MAAPFSCAFQTANHQSLGRNRKKLGRVTEIIYKFIGYVPTFQRIFGRAEEARGAGPTLGPPLYAIARSNWSPEYG